MQELTSKSKAALSVVTDKVSDASQVVVQKIKDVVLDNEGGAEPG